MDLVGNIKHCACSSCPGESITYLEEEVNAINEICKIKIKEAAFDNRKHSYSYTFNNYSMYFTTYKVPGRKIQYKIYGQAG